MYNFIHIPKTGGSTIFNLNHAEIAYAGHIRAIDIPTFAIVRNPYDRLVSAFFYLKSGGGNNELDLSYQELLLPFDTFGAFVLHIEKCDLIDKIIHIKPMCYWICDAEKKMIVNRVFKIEQPDEIDAFLSEIGIEKKFSETKENASIHEHYSHYLDKEVISEINRLYNFDFELLGYEKL